MRSSAPASSQRDRDGICGVAGAAHLHAESGRSLRDDLRRERPRRVGTARDHRAHSGARPAARASPPDRVPTACRPRRPTRRRPRTPRRASGRAPAYRPRCAPRPRSGAAGARRPRAVRAPAGPRRPPRPLPAVERCAEQGLHRGERARGVVALVGTVQGNQHLGVAGVRGAHVEQAAPDRQPVGDTPEVLVSAPRPRPHRRRGRLAAGGPRATVRSRRRPPGCPASRSRSCHGRCPRASGRGPRCGRS